MLAEAMMSVEAMVAASLMGRGVPVEINGRQGSVRTRGVLSAETVGGGGVGATRRRHVLTIPLSVPVMERDMAMVAGRDYAVRSVMEDSLAKIVEVEEHA